MDFILLFRSVLPLSSVKTLPSPQTLKANGPRTKRFEGALYELAVFNKLDSRKSRHHNVSINLVEDLSVASVLEPPSSAQVIVCYKFVSLNYQVSVSSCWNVCTNFKSLEIDSNFF